MSKRVFTSFHEAAKAIRDGVISSLELTKNVLNRIEKYNPALNAIITVLTSEALARAEEADAALSEGLRWGPLHGVPITVKDAYEIKGVRTTGGAPFLTNHIPQKNAVVVDRLLNAGAVILGHTNVPFMSADLQSYNEIFGTTNNPWDLKRTPGGSTGGGAAAVAAGLSYLSVGSDLAGSIRTPAHFCGVYGHKPTLNVIPLNGHIPPPPNARPQPEELLAVAGILARSATDLKIALEILGGPESENSIAYRWSLPPARQARLSEYRIGFRLDDPLCPVDSVVKDVLNDAISAISKTGVEFTEGWPEGVNPSEQFNTYQFLLESHFAFLLKDDKIDEMRQRALNQDGSHEAIRAWAWTAPHKHFKTAESTRMAARAVWQDYFRNHDAFLMPTAFTTAFPHMQDSSFWKRTLQTKDGARNYGDLTFWTSFATLAGLPATTMPVGMTIDGLPVGLQIVGPYLEDATVLDIAEKFADILGGFQPAPGYENFCENSLEK